MKFDGKIEIVKEVQTALGLKADGIDGPKTWKMVWEQLVHDGKGEPEKPEPAVETIQDDYPEVFKSSPNQSGTISPKYIILHHSAGSHDGTRSWILNSKSKVSYHYLIAADGSLTQFVSDTKKSWHAGRSHWNGISGLNSHSIGVSFYGDTNTRTPSAAEIDSCAKKCVYLMSKFGLDESRILTHEQIAPGRKNDCSKETLELVLKRIKEV